MLRSILIGLLAVCTHAKYIDWDRDPNYCNVCTTLIHDIQGQMKYISYEKNVGRLEGYLHRHCHHSNRRLEKEEKNACEFVLQHMRSISTPLSRDTSAKEICQILERLDASICDLKYKKSTRLERVPRPKDDL